MGTRNIGDLERDKFFQPNSTQKFSFSTHTKHYFALAEAGAGVGCNGYDYVNKFGRVLNYGTSIVDVNDLGTPAVYAWLTSASSLEAISSSAADSAAGAGARTIVVEGLDSDFNEVSETITMNGLSATTATTTEFIRVHRAYVATSGIYADTDTGSHDGNITVRLESAGATQIYLNSATAPVGQSLVARYTIPAGKTGYLTHASFSSAGNKAADFYMWRRFNADTVAAPYGVKRIIETFNGVAESLDRSWDVPIKLPEKTDIWASAVGAGTGTNSSVAFDIILVDNDS
jgi:hypothetical protein